MSSSARLVLAAALTLLAPGWARAQSEADRLEANRLLREGNRLFEAGDYRAALAQFRLAYEKVPTPKLYFNLGQAHRRLGQPVEAIELYERFLAEAVDVTPALRQEAAGFIPQLEAGLGRLAVDVDVPGARVFVNGRPRGTTPLAAPLRVAPGSHVLRVSVPGRTLVHAETVVVRGPGATVPVAVRLAEPPAPDRRWARGVVAARAPAPRAPGAPPPRGLFVTGRLDVDPKARGAGGAVGLGHSLGEAVGLQLAGLVRPAEGRPFWGVAPGASLALGGAVRARVGAGVPIYFRDGVRAGLAGAAGIEIRPGAWAIRVEAAVERLFAPPAGLPQLLIFPALGLDVWP